MQKISVLLPNLFSMCTYWADEKLPFGTFVRVPFGKSEQTGVVWNEPVDDAFAEEKIKQIKQICNICPLSEKTMHFVDWVANYTLCAKGMILKMVLPVDVLDKSKKPVIFNPPVLCHSDMHFSDEQENAINAILPKIKNTFSTTLIDGITGSGKTAVYFEAIEKALQNQKQVLVMLPEITLTAAWLLRFEERFHTKPAVWHSAMTPKQRKDTWHAVFEGSAQVLVGARSALFLPFKDLGLIVVDEEHDPSYKQEDGVLYQARDMAVVRAQIEKCPILLASATPSLETYANVQSGKFDCVRLTKRFANATLPDIELIDMRQESKQGKHILSCTLQTALAENIVQQNQSLLFLNRRGYAPVRLCRSCGEKVKCPHCSVFLTEHKTQHKLVCHQCGYTRNLTDDCPYCHEKNSLISCGAGVEKVYEEVKNLFPNARIKLVSSDTVASVKAFDELCTQLAQKQVDILIGTQMLAKGHNFPDLTLVGIVDGDFGLSGSDLRAAERTFQLLQQVAGRAGRSNKKGKAFIQTYSPQNNVIQALTKEDSSIFMQTEMAARQLLSMPPFGRLAALIISGKNKDLACQCAKTLIKHAPFIQGVEILGPVEAPLFLLRGKYRYRILIKSIKEIGLQKVISEWLKPFNPPKNISVRIDIDPYSFM